MRWTFLIAVALSVSGPIDAHRLRTGRFVYHDLDHGHEIGRAELTIRRLPAPERYEFSAAITGKFDQRWTTIATPAFEPISATITFGRDTAPRFSLAYRAGRVTGFVVRGSRQSVDTVVPAGIVDQRIDWAAVMATDLAPGSEFHFSVYDPSIGVSAVTVTVGDVQRLTVLAGTFDVYPITYRIAKATGPEQYQVFATRDVPRMAVREIFPNGVVSDLGEIATLATPPG
jgi:hypothetical protein